MKKKTPVHNDGYLERIAQDLIRLQFWFEGYRATNQLSTRMQSSILSLHQAMLIVREQKQDEHGSKDAVE